MGKYTHLQPDQQESHQNSNPYYVPSNKSGNLFQKIKGFFNSRNQPSNKNNININNNDNAQEAINSSKKTKKPYNFDNVNVSAIDLSINSNLSFTSKNPNDTLSEFFNKKGDAPLNDIEIEGVMSLIRKSQNSRAPSRNTSTFLTNNNNNNNNHHHSMFLNSNLDSKLNNGLTSFNDMNNTTILRPASKNLKKPVRINTPTFKSKKPLTSTDNNNNNNNTLNNTSINNLTVMNKSSFINNSNISRSFINKNGITKRRIVDYSMLQSPYKLRNSSSSLTAFLEKKKLLEKQANEEKKKSLLSVSKSDSKQKDKVYNGGIIDLSTLDDDDDDDDDNDNNNNNNNITKQELNTEKKKTLQESKTENISKTASKLLEILDSDDSNKKLNVSENTKKDKKKNDDIDIDTDSIIILDKKPETLKHDIKISSPPTMPLNKPVISTIFNNSTAKSPNPTKNEGEEISNQGVKKIANETKPLVEKETIEKEIKDSKPFLFTTKNETCVNDKKIMNKKSDETFKPGFTFDKTLKAPITFGTTKSSDFKFETQPQQIQTSTLFTSETKPKDENKSINKTDVEVIDSFLFPEVEGKQDDQYKDDIKNNNDEINCNSNFNFVFPMIPPISEKSLTLVRNSSKDLYNDVFKF